jgi:hypothetical protein
MVYLASEKPITSSKKVIRHVVPDLFLINGTLHSIATSPSDHISYLLA